MEVDFDIPSTAEQQAQEVSVVGIATINDDAVNAWISQYFTPATEDNQPILSDNEVKPKRHGLFRMLQCPKVSFRIAVK